jgi:hypothetical protein
VSLVDVGRAVEDGQHQPAAEEQLHVRPQREPERERETIKDDEIDSGTRDKKK